MMMMMMMLKVWQALEQDIQLFYRFFVVVVGLFCFYFSLRWHPTSYMEMLTHTLTQIDKKTKNMTWHHMTWHEFTQHMGWGVTVLFSDSLAEMIVGVHDFYYRTLFTCDGLAALCCTRTLFTSLRNTRSVPLTRVPRPGLVRDPCAHKRGGGAVLYRHTYM